MMHIDSLYVDLPVPDNLQKVVAIKANASSV